MRITDGRGHEQVDPAATDVADTRLYAEGDPHQVWRAALERRPVWWQPVPGKDGFWSVTRYPDVERVLAEHETFTSERGNLLDSLGKGDSSAGRQLAATDPPRHAVLRSPIQRLLTAQKVQRHAETMRAEAKQILAGIPDGEPVDFAALSARYSMVVTAHVLGVRPEELLELLPYAHGAMAPDDPEYQISGDRDRTMQQCHWELFAYFSEIVAKRRGGQDASADGGADGLIDELLGIEVDGRLLDNEEVVANCYGLVLGSNVAMPHVPNSTLVELSPTGDFGVHAEAVRAEGCRLFVEEALRWSSPGMHFMRHATEDVTIGDQMIRAGDAVVAWIGAANRDPEQFDRPYAFDPTRRPNRHLAFGAGPHYCVGHTVARLALVEFFTELFAQLDDVVVEGEVRHLRGNVAAGITRLPVIARRR